ncbi:phosphoribosylglycinamide formyltransferase-1 [Poseidonocella pacifica]|uniref:Phosphoribosylglycinamide formyltransferase n=1 Tax=Poseidonocella pacifica TaxID=871651 RepID=A0A1I0VE22_9RHOB|nr:phosphoribosylglycinamide formyltransferase [Poseidonocella pacifica]SFA74230.1 phosphoribosylglycinamide formyltransferase-1 [Poseidonocella pacifica]
MSLRVGILISGGGSNMVKLVQSMTGSHPARPCVVLSNRPDAGGLDVARSMGIPTEAVDHRPFGGDRIAFEDELTRRLSYYSPDILCLAGFMRVLSERFVQQWDGRMLNIHPSLLPKYKGLDTHARALASGDSTAGCSVHLVTPALDDGPILGQATVPIHPEDTAQSLAARVLVEEHRLYPQVLSEFVSRLAAGLPIAPADATNYAQAAQKGPTE